MISDPNKLDSVRTKFAALCHSIFFHDMRYHYDNVLDRLNLLTLHALFLINVFNGTKFCPSVLETAFGFLLGTFVTLTRSLALSQCPQLDVFQPQMQFVNIL
jgi:hypothetical protein